LLVMECCPAPFSPCPPWGLPLGNGTPASRVRSDWLPPIDLSGLGLMVPALPRDCDVPGFMFPPFPCSTVPDDALPLGSGTSDSPVRSDCDPPFGPVASGLIFSGACANITPVLIQAATNTDPVTANGLRFIMPPFELILLGANPMP